MSALSVYRPSRTDEFLGAGNPLANSILIVDDQSSVREILDRWLGAAGYDTRQAPDAETALEMMISSPPDVVLCDVEMPGHGGLWLVERIRERFSAAAVVLATGVDSVPPSIGLQGGVTGYVVKPFDRARLLDAVKQGVHWHNTALANGAGQTATSDPVADWLGGDDQETK
jgi:two-component system chemotaxis response regulator CheY